jgi:hypothetical protein
MPLGFMTFGLNNSSSGASSTSSTTSSSDSSNDIPWTDMTECLCHGWEQYRSEDKYKAMYKLVGKTAHIKAVVKNGDDKWILHNLPKEITPKYPAYKTESGHSHKDVQGEEHLTVVQTNGTLEARTFSTFYTAINISYEID